jgi:hypothetical protein
MTETTSVQAITNELLGRVTAYQIRNMLNARIRAAGFDKVYPGPQIYSYAKAGLIDGIKRDTMTGVTFDKIVAEVFIDRIVERHNSKWNKIVETPKYPLTMQDELQCA